MKGNLAQTKSLSRAHKMNSKVNIDEEINKVFEGLDSSNLQVSYLLSKFDFSDFRLAFQRSI